MEKFSSELISLKVNVKDWKEGIREAGNILLKKGYIDKEYIDGMITAVEKLGPYIVLAPGIAFAHSSPGEYVNHTGISLITLQEGVNFDHKTNDPVTVIFAIASKDNSDHIQILRKISMYLQNESNLNYLMSADESADKENIVKKIIEGEKI